MPCSLPGEISGQVDIIHHFSSQETFLFFLGGGKAITSICEDTKSNHPMLPESQIYKNHIHS